MRACEKTLENFACVQKGSGRGWVTLDEGIKAEMARNGVQPDTWIVPPGMKSFAALEEASVEYYRAGPIASKNIERGGKQNDTFRGNEVFTCNSYRLDNAEVDTNPFVRDRVLGDYFVVRNWGFGRVSRPPAGAGVPAEARANWDNMSQKTSIYCCETDKWETFDLEDVARHYYTHVLGGDNSTRIGQTLVAEQTGEGANAEAGPVQRALRQALITQIGGGGGGNLLPGQAAGGIVAAPAPGAAPAALADANLTAAACFGDIDGFVRLCTGFTYDAQHQRQGDPDAGRIFFSFLCMRPFRRYRMGSAVLMATGLDTGFTAHAHEDVQVGDDPISHVHVTHFTGWFSSTIIDTKRVAVAHDVFCMGYQAGEGKKLVEADDFTGHHPYQFMFETQEDKGSVFAMLAPKDYGKPGATGDNDLPKNPIDMSGTDDALPCGGDHKMAFPAFNESIWGFGKWAQGAATGNDLVNEASRFSADPYVNMLCFQTMQKVISSNGSNDFEFGAYIRNTDHFGADHIGPGSRSSRNGGFAALKHFNYDTLKVL